MNGTGPVFMLFEHNFVHVSGGCFVLEEASFFFAFLSWEFVEGLVMSYCRSEADLMNVVEQRIQHSQREGDFENLSGKGKPLEMVGNPHADPDEDIAYRVLAKNGFAPEWVELNKDIRFRIWRWRAALRLAWQQQQEDTQRDECEKQQKWTTLLVQFEEELQDVNRKVFLNILYPVYL
jgi:DnaJ family protein C protein 28